MRVFEAVEQSSERAALMTAVSDLLRRRTELDLALRSQLVELYNATQGGVQRYVADELAILLAESSRTTQRWLDDAMVLDCHPHVRALVEDGTWTLRHADAVMDELFGLSDDEAQQVVDLVLRQKGARTPHELRKAARAAVYLVDPEAAERAAEKAKQGRSVTSIDVRDGSATLLMNGPKAAIAAAMAGLDALCGVKAPEDDRTLLQRRFDTLMGLITGQVTAVGGHVTMLVSLATLEGGDAPAEIPGLGFITAEEAREVVAGADEIRRAVVDDEGQLVSLDHQVARPEAQEGPEQQPLLSDEVEPELPVADTDDEEWLPVPADEAPFQAKADWYEHLGPGPDTPESERGQAHLRALLDALISHERATGRRVNDAYVRLEDDGTVRLHYKDDPYDPPPDGGGGGSDPPPLPTQPLPAGFVDDRLAQREQDAGLGDDLRLRWASRTIPSWGVPPVQEPEECRFPAPTLHDLDWWSVHPDRAMAHALIQDQAPTRPTAPAPSTGWPQAAPAPRPWSADALDRLLRDLVTRPVPPPPPASTGYLFRGALARFIKLRDQSCRFPGCSRLAARCDTDHCRVWPFGATSADNGNALCEHHHQCKHAVIRLEALGRGWLRWTTPTGHTADVAPRVLLRGW